MLKTRLLKSVFFAALLLTGFLLIYIYFVIHPSYRDLLVENAEDEAVRYVSFLVHVYDLDQKPIPADFIPIEVAQDIGRFSDDSQLIKLRVFDAAGKIIFSTMPREIGRLNEHDYFHEIVAAGDVYSKTVRKDNFTAEMEVVETDLVETYVPIMGNGTFRGAIETYYDITKSSMAISSLTARSLFFLSVLSFILLSLLYYALRQADQSILARVKAEEELLKANEDLESRVAERAGEILRVNQSLSEEVSERTLAQVALSEALADMEEAKEKIDGILRSVNDGLLVVDQDEKIVLMNRPAEDIAGILLEDASGKSIHELELADTLKDTLLRLLADPDSSNTDFELTRPAPEHPRILQARTSVLRDREDLALGTVILMQDVTIAREVDQMKSDFLAMAAHELMTPLASIMGYSELLTSETVKELTADQQSEFLNYIYHKAEGLSRIVDDLLDLSRIESGQQISIVKIEFDLNAVVARLLEAYRKVSSSHQFVLEVKCDNCKLVADPIRIEQVMENLLSNAVKYSPDGGEIRIECSGDKQFCRFSIIDQGIGMSAEQVEHVFDKFYRVDASDTARQGVGLGMSIAQHIIEAHHGAIEVSSRPGQGTCISFSLPRNR